MVDSSQSGRKSPLMAGRESPHSWMVEINLALLP
jgi:hypothetical protein